MGIARCRVAQKPASIQYPVIRSGTNALNPCREVEKAIDARCDVPRAIDEGDIPMQAESAQQRGNHGEWLFLFSLSFSFSFSLEFEFTFALSFVLPFAFSPVFVFSF